MIIVKNRELLIPNNERYIGTTYDNDTENRVFQVPRFSQRGVDLANLTFRLDIQYANEAFDTVVLGKEVGEAFIILIWRITSAALQVPGTMYIGLRAIDDEATVKWSSFSAAMYAERHLNTPGNYSGSLTEIEQMEHDFQYMKGVIDDLNQHIAYKSADAEAWARGTREGHPVGSDDETYQNNAKYYSEQADVNGEKWARGTIDGTPVGPEDQAYNNNSKYYSELTDHTGERWTRGTIDGVPVPSSDETYQNNAKYYSDLRENASHLAEAWAAGTYNGNPLSPGDIGYHDNSKYWSDLARGFVGQVSYKKVYSSVSEMAADTTLVNGQVVRTLGYYSDTSLGGAYYRIMETEPQTYYEPVANNMYAMLIMDPVLSAEVFGAKGDGTTDDTQAIKNMFATGKKKFVFLHDKYRVTGGIDVSVKDTEIDFGTITEFNLAQVFTLRDFDYVIGFKATGIKVRGHLNVYCNYAVNIGVFLSECGVSSFEHISVQYARAYGICTDISHSNLGSMRFDYLGATACGYKVKAKAIATAKGNMLITGINIPNLTEEAIRSLFDVTKFKAAQIVIDDSNYQDIESPNCGQRWAWIASAGISLDETDVTKGTISTSAGTVYGTIYADFNDNGEPRDVFLPIGGGIKLNPARSEGLCDIYKCSTMRCPIGLTFNFQYGGTIRNFASQYDTVAMLSNSMSLSIDYLYKEALGTGFNVTKYKNIILLAPNANTQIYVTWPYVGQGNIPFEQENEIICTSLGSRDIYSNTVSALHCPSYLARQKLEGTNFIGTTAAQITINEYSPLNITGDITGLISSKRFITIDLVDPNRVLMSKFGPVHVYIHKRSNVGQYNSPLTITLSQNLIDLGYTLYGAVDNIVSIDVDSYNRAVEIVIMLFEKKFYVKCSTIDFIDNTQ